MTERAYWLAWSQIKGLGATLIKRIQDHFGNLSEPWNLPVKHLGEVNGFGNKLISTIEREKFKINPHRLLEKHLINNPNFWTPADESYPRLLLEIPSPPPVLYFRGKIDLQENLGIKPAIAIVGTRHPTKYGKDWTKRIAITLTLEGFTIVSGMAAGIDTEAHWGCLNTGGRTIAVLGTGIDNIYPYSNKKLYEKIQTQGLIVSEYAKGTKPERGNFPARNRIIAGLCRGVIIMEAPQRSGALITARFANEFCRDVYVLPGSLDNQQSIGCLNLLNNGAHVILSERNLLEMLGTMPTLDIKSVNNNPVKEDVDKNLSINKTIIPELEPPLDIIFQNIKTDSLSLDEIAIATSLDTATLLASLSQLELMDLISQLPGMRYIRKLDRS